MRTPSRWKVARQLLQKQQIGVRGVYVDRIVSMTTTPLSLDMTEVFRSRDLRMVASCLESFFSNAEQLVSSLPEIYPTGQPRHKACWRTVIGDDIDAPSSDSEQGLKSRGISRSSRHDIVRPATSSYSFSYERMRRSLQSNQAPDDTNTGQKGIRVLLNARIFGKMETSSLPKYCPKFHG